MNLKELKSLIRLLRKEGITYFKSEEVELKLGERPVPHRTKEIDVPVAVQPQFSEMDTLLWSSGGGELS